MARRPGFGFPAFPNTPHGQYLAESYIAMQNAVAAPPTPAEFVSFSSGDEPTLVAGTALTVNRPSGAQTGDVMVLGIRGQFSSTGTTHFSNADWSSVTGAYSVNANTRFSEIHVRRITNIGAEASSWAFPKPAGWSGNRVGYLCVLLRGIDADTQVIGGSGITPTTSLTFPGHSVTAGKATDLTVLFACTEFSAGQGHTITASPAGYTSIGQLVAYTSGSDTTVGRTALRAVYKTGASVPAAGAFNWDGTETAPVTMAVTLRSVI